MDLRTKSVHVVNYGNMIKIPFMDINCRILAISKTKKTR